MRVPDGIEPVTGYRVWTLKGDRLHPYGISRGAAWNPGPNEAVCYSDLEDWEKKVLRNTPEGVVQETILTHGPIPEEKCNCGIWSLNGVDEAVKKAAPRANDMFSSFYELYFGTPPKKKTKPSPLNPNVVVGEVRGWGRVVVGEQGHRAEFAEIVALYSILPDQDLSAVAEFYGIPVVARPDLLPEPKPKEEPKEAPTTDPRTDWPSLTWHHNEALMKEIGLEPAPKKSKRLWNLLGGI